ncbi:hypothetical protein Q8W71_16085 [Methylobacterium sp. NEAU 140]|uniref:hypothetical protein n=1 Tax=Methylobacterium sp. NEAU 140 TaxID=3064945 RepID=UPI00273446A9|nr:hypothetical protein [Methylobacterium sp. NEAU 140]MDP4024149.1 hypothetical protein [Methylobacterium sp. NEAU 140]
MTHVTITPELHSELLVQVDRIEKHVSNDRMKLRGLRKGTEGHTQLQNEIRRMARQTNIFRKQIAHLASGSATKEEEEAFTRIVCEFIRDNQQRHRESMSRWCKKMIGEEMVVPLPDGGRAPAWELWLAQILSTQPDANYLTDESVRISQIYQDYAPNVPHTERFQRAFRTALRGIDLAVEGDQFDADDMTVLMILNGLCTEDFTINEVEYGPLVLLNADTIRRLGAKPGSSTLVH